MLRRILGSSAFQLVVGLCFIGFFVSRWVEGMGGPAAVWERFGLLAPAVSVPVQVLVAVTPFPSDLLCIANGTIYGLWWGALLSWIGWYLAAWIEFGIGRRARSELPIAEWTAQLPRRLRTLPVGHPAFLIGSRFVPWAGGHISTLMPGAVGVPSRRFAWCAAVAILPPSVITAAVGAGLLSI